MRRSSPLAVLTLAVLSAARLFAAPESVVAPATAANAATEQAAASEPAKPAEPFANLSARSVGPSIGGRVARVAGVPGDPLTFYAATAAGGVWKSVNAGIDWKPIFDEQGVFSIGSIAVAPSDPQIVYVGSGEANIRGNVAAGNGIYRSTDAGKTWGHVWKQEGQIGTIAVHPADANVAFAAVLGRAFGPNPERGVYRTLDGGKSWTQVLAKNADTGASDVTFDPSNPRKLFAGLWQARRFPWDLSSGGPGSGLYVSTDLGDTWKRLEGGGLPKGIWGKVGVRVAPSDSNRVYALIEAEEGGLFRSDDGGDTWRRQNPTRALRQRAWYYTCLTVDPKNAEVVWFPQVPMLRTIDGGTTVQEARGGGWDYHDVWIDPLHPQRMAVGSDGGVSLSVDGGATWRRPPLPIAQLYHVTVDNRRPYWLYASAQDYGTVVGPSHALDDSGIRLGAWYGAGGGEAGHIAADPSDPNVVYAGEYLGYISRYDHQSHQVRNVSIYPENLSGHGVADGRVRFQWTAPILISPHDPETVYHAANLVFRTRDGGATWLAISPDLTRDDKSKQQWSGGPITGDNTGVEFYGTVFALAESPLERGLLWAGSDDGLVHVSRDGGNRWDNVTARLPDLPEWATVRTIEASQHAAGTAFLVADAHRLGDRRPYLWRTDDYGQSWKSLTAGLDATTHLHVVREDPTRKDLLYLGAEGGVRVSWDGGATWSSPKLGLPPAAVHSLVVAQGDLVIGTMGRSIWIFDDLTPLRQWKPDLAGRFELFPARSAVRWEHGSTASDEAEGANPPNGATLHYQLDADLAASEELTLEILDASGRVVRKLSSVPPPPKLPVGDPERSPWTEDPKGLPKTRGLHRVVWDLREEAAQLIPRARIDWGDPSLGPLALPGVYALRLSVAGAGSPAAAGGETRQATTTLVLEQNPNARGVTDVDLRAQHDLAIEIRDTMSRLTADVLRLRSARDQLRARSALLRSEAAPAGGSASSAPAALATLSAEAAALADELDALERRFHNPTAEVTYDILAMRGGAQLYSRLSPLYGFAADGDGAPTQGVREVFAGQKKELEALEGELAVLLGDRLADINRQARDAGVEFVRVR